jgi:hypothetical protein
VPLTFALCLCTWLTAVIDGPPWVRFGAVWFAAWFVWKVYTSVRDEGKGKV